MKTTKTILVGIDYSIPSINALKEAIRIAAAQDLRVVCFHILNEEVLKDFYENVSFDTAIDFVAAHEKLDEFIRSNTDTKQKIDAFIKVGNPFEEIIKLVNDHQVQTLVLGSYGLRNNDTPQHIGALASCCVRKAPVEVLLIRGDQNKSFKNIGACIDFSETSIRAAHRAAELASQDGANLKLIYIYRPPFYADSDISWISSAFPMVNVLKVKKSYERKLEQLGNEIIEKHHLEDVSFAVGSAHNVSHGIYEILKEMDADLIVLGTRGRTLLKNIFLGTTAESLLNRTPCSTLLVKPKGYSYEL